jgi:hypothetical protein
MKPPETVTLIDLEGKPITNPLASIEDLASLQVWFSYEHIEDDSDIAETVALHSSPWLIATVRDSYKNIIKLRDFINDQLTLIRKGLDVGHFNDLAIYQTTLGQYWEVPWYNIPSIWKELEPLTIGELHNILPELMYTPYNEIQRPRLDIFLKHYPDVFSKLTPWKGVTA